MMHTSNVINFCVCGNLCVQVHTCANVHAEAKLQPWVQSSGTVYCF